MFKIVPRPPERNVVGSKWMYAIKWKKNVEVERQKARSVAKGFTQVIEEDYDEIYASVACLKSVHLVYAIATSQRLKLWQVDFVSAFLNSNSPFDVYMEKPMDFQEGGSKNVWKLLKTLYGTMQGTHNWAENLDATFKRYGYYRSRADPQIQSRVVEDEFTLTST